MVLFYVTGFGPFAGVSENPTEQLIRRLEQHSEDRGARWRVAGTAVLEVAGAASRQWVAELFSTRLPQAGSEPVVVLHLGVDVKADHFKLEQQAVNEASFRVPDQRGWQPHQQLVDDHPGLTLATRLCTDLELADLAERLEARRHDVRPSQDAGRFVCNYTYYRSLLESQKARQRAGRPLHTLFLHVPPLAVAPLDAQFACLLDLLTALAAQLTPPEEAEAAAAAGAAAGAAADVGCVEEGAVLAAPHGPAGSRVDASSAAATQPAAAADPLVQRVLAALAAAVAVLK